MASVGTRCGLAVLTTLVMAGHHPLSAQQARVATPPPANGANASRATERARTPAEAAERLRALWALRDYNTAADLGARYIQQFPSNPRVLAWYAAMLRNTAHADRGDSIAATLDTTGRDPIVTGLATWIRLYGMAPNATEQRRLVARLGEMATRSRSEDLVALLIQMASRTTNGDYEKAATLSDSIAKVFGNTPLLKMHALHARLIAQRFGANARDTLTSAKLLAEVVDFARQHPHDLRVLELATEAADYSERSDLSLALRSMMVARSPRASGLRADYWSDLGATSSISRDGRKALVDLDRRYYLASVDSAPWAMGSVLSSVRRTDKTSPDIAVLERLIETRAPRSAWHERVLKARVDRWNDSLTAALDTTKRERPDSVAMRKRYVAEIDAFLNKGWRAERSHSTSLALIYVSHLRRDSLGPTEPLVRVARMIEREQEGNGYWVLMVARTLADRGVALGLADSLAKKAERILLEEANAFRFGTIKEQADRLDGIKAEVQDAYGWIALKAGRLGDADKHFAKGLEFNKRSINLYLHLGRLRMLQGKPDEAESAWGLGMTVKSVEVNPNKAELEKLYRQRRGSLDGWNAYLASLEEKERTLRKERILAAKVDSMFTPPAIAESLLAGDSVTTASLKGKTVVMNFWGTWCSPCVAEMPEIQQFHEKYKNDPNVVLLTIANDADRDVLVKWLADRKYTMPTVWSKGYVASAAILGFPTTWFVAPDGRVHYVSTGNQGLLVEEWSWMVEALKNLGK